MDDEKLFEQRKAKALEFLRKKYLWLSYIALAILVWFSVWLRTLNLSKLKDVTTGSWTLGPDLDPFLFLRWTKYIVQHGSLMTIDTMRYVPLGFDVRNELVLHTYVMAWFHKIAVHFGSTSVEQSSVIFPVFMFAITVIAFFFFARILFIDTLGAKKANLIALISSFFFITIPSLLPRTIAGIPEKESAAFFYLAVAFYFFIAAWKAKKQWHQISLAVISGLSTGAMALIWGGYTYVFLAIGVTLLITFLLGETSRKKLYIALAWMIPHLIITSRLFTLRYVGFMTSFIALIPLLAIGSLIIYNIIFHTRLKRHVESFHKVPRPVIALVCAVVLGALGGMVLRGPSFIFDKFRVIQQALIRPISDRLGLTVAENRQPFFSEWADSFGPVIRGIPFFFWLFLIGSIYLYWNMVSHFTKRERTLTTSAYAFFIASLIFGRYSGSSIFNGTSFASIAFYSLGLIAFLGTFGYYYYQYYKKGESEKLLHIDVGYILLSSFFILGVIGARAAVRLVMVLVPPTSIIVAYFLVVFSVRAWRSSGDLKRILSLAAAGIIIIAALFSAYAFYNESKNTAQNYAPYDYTQQWQKAMAWVRTSTPTNAVFGHWWDYGYWIQTIGERATVLDGGNAIPYWNHLMGRYALTGPDNDAALSFLYAHNTTHFLIDSSDIGKYSAFSTIGSDQNYDRASWLAEFQKDPSQTREAKNATTFVYGGGTTLDADVMYSLNGTQVFLPAGKAAIIGVMIIRQQSKLTSVQGLYIDCLECAQKGLPAKQYAIPLRYVYDKTLIDFGSGLDAGVFLFPRATQTSAGLNLDVDGALLYLSNRTVKSQLARLYLYNENNPSFTLAHSEDDALVAYLKSQNANIGDFVDYQGLRGPIRIWEIHYPQGMVVNESYLRTTYPDTSVQQA
ncbi:hypothetical protein KW805_04340 [Candidatus Pacearchaeota archaeon]|nr:hypothetical protein [Candidatus Pacearchaeota archaeon]